MTPLRVRRGAALLVAILLAASALMLVNGRATAGAASKDLPPSTKAALAKMFRKEMKPFGLRVSRGLLQNTENYEPDPEGTHLALYLSPTSTTYTTDDYIANFAKITRVFVPMVFNRWPRLQSFDICQEAVNDTRESPPPVTQIFVTRTALDKVGNWKKATLVELLAAAPDDRRQRGADYYVYFNPTIRTAPAFEKAADEADYDAYRTFG